MCKTEYKWFTGKVGFPETRARHKTLDEARNRLDHVENVEDPEGIKAGHWYLDGPEDAEHCFVDASTADELAVVTEYTEEELIKAVGDHLRSMSDGEDLAEAVQSLWGCVDVRFVGPNQYEVHE